MRRLVAVLSSVGLSLGVLVGVTTPASAADLGTVTVSSGTPPTVSPSVITGQVGDTFTIAYSGGAGLVVIGAAVSQTGGSNCAVSNTCTVTSPGASFTIDGAGNVIIDESALETTLTIVIGGGSGPTDPALIYATAYLNYNGGRCTARQKVTRLGGLFTHIDLPFGLLCERSGYSLAGWARSADATTSEFASGTQVPIGNESFTLYAVWVPNGSLITYDANIGANDACIDRSGTNVPSGDGRVVTELNPANLAISAPCAPGNAQLELAGWATSGDGSVAYELGAVVPFAVGTRQRLFAVWQGVPEEMTPGLSIEGQRGDVRGRSGVIVNGESVGLEPGTTLIPYLRFPGMTEYSQGSARPEVQADGTFTWTRKTGKRTSVYFTSEDGSVRSNMVIVPAA